MDKDSKVDDLAHKLGSYMDTLPVVKYPWNEIPNLKETDPKWIKAMQSIQNSPDVESEYIKLMTQRDNQGEPRPGGKKGNDELFNGVKQGTEDPVVILKLPTGMYAVGGRTRMYAALASKTNIKAIILTPEILSKFVNS
jgi:hypothetical protein